VEENILKLYCCLFTWQRFELRILGFSCSRWRHH